MSVIIKKISKAVLLILGIILLLFVVLLVVRVIIQGVNKKQYEITTANRIDAEEIVEIGGIEQCLYIRGDDTSNPVILYLHGGPGSSMIPIIYKYQRTLEEAYTIVNWDQRTAGKTYLLNDKNTAYNSLSMERMVSLFRCVCEKPDELMDALRYVLNSREDFDLLKTALARNSPASDVQKAEWFYRLSATATPTASPASTASPTISAIMFVFAQKRLA